MFISGIQQSDLVLAVFSFFRLFSLIDYYKTLSIESLVQLSPTNSRSLMVFGSVTGTLKYDVTHLLIWLQPRGMVVAMGLEHNGNSEETATLGAEAVKCHWRELVLGNVGAMSGGSEGMMHWTSSRWKAGLVLSVARVVCACPCRERGIWRALCARLGRLDLIPETHPAITACYIREARQIHAPFSQSWHLGWLLLAIWGF